MRVVGFAFLLTRFIDDFFFAYQLAFLLFFIVGLFIYFFGLFFFAFLLATYLSLYDCVFYIYIFYRRHNHMYIGILPMPVIVWCNQLGRGCQGFCFSIL